MKTIASLFASLLLISAFAGCFGGDISGCTDSDALNYDSDASDDDGSCDLPMSEEEVAAAIVAQMDILDPTSTSSEKYGMETTTSTSEDGMEMATTMTQIIDVENNRMRFEFNIDAGIMVINYEIRQVGETINVHSEDQWYLVRDANIDIAEMFEDAVGMIDDSDEENEEMWEDAEFECENGMAIPLDWANDGAEDCADGSDEGLTQQEIDARTVMDEVEPDEDGTMLPNFEIADASLLTMSTSGGHQFASITVDGQSIAYEFDAAGQLVGMELNQDGDSVSIQILYGDDLLFEVSESYERAAQPYMLEMDDVSGGTDWGYVETLYWDCSWAIKADAFSNFTVEEFTTAFDGQDEQSMPDWCGENVDAESLVIDDTATETFFEEGWVITNDGSWAMITPQEGGLDAVFWDYWQQLCDEDDGTWNASDETCSLTSSGTIEADGEFAHLVSDMDDDDWLRHAVVGDDTIIATLTEDMVYAQTVSPTVITYDIESDLPLEADAHDFRLDLGFSTYDEEEIDSNGGMVQSVSVSFNLADGMSGSAVDSDGANWSFEFIDTNGDSLIGPGDAFVIETDAEGASEWDVPSARLYDGWAEGYTDESPVKLPGFGLIGLISMLGIAALSRRP
ncbi:MAG TPA: hypothetical protein EYQ80_03055 [Candidatus Poseidoniales archaeon]|nr:hypothetical protein [Candidatus Poseidoniales archaeon]